MSRKADLAENTVILAIGKISTQFINFLLLPLYTSLLLPEEYGIVDLFNTYVVLLVPIFNLQFDTGLFRFMIDCRKNEEKKTELLSTVINSNFVQVFIYLIFYIIFARFITLDFKAFLAADVVLTIFLNTLLQYARGIGSNKKYSLGSFICATLIVLLNVIFIAIYKLGALGIFLSTIISKVITIVFMIISCKVWENYSLKAGNTKTFKALFKYSIPLIPNQLSWWVIGVSDRTIISSVLSIAKNGIYSVANKFSSVYISLFNIFNLSWTESVSLHIKDKDSDSFICETINEMYSIFSSICFCIIAFMPFVFNILVDKKYLEAYNQIPILMIAVLFQVIVGLYSTVYVAKKKSVEIAKTSTFAAVINIVINLLLIKKIGIYASSLSTLISYLTMALYRYYDIKKYVDSPFSKKNIILSGLTAVIIIICYYLNILILNLISIVVVILYSFIINKKMINYVFNYVKKIIGRNKNEI